MRSPSADRLERAFGITRKEANLIKRIAKADDDADELESLINRFVPQTESYVRQMYSRPYRSSMWRTTVALHAIDVIVGGYGVEALYGRGWIGMEAPDYEYINMGDTYATTLIYKRATDNLFISTWGDIVERERL